jgi:hypothetical protein
MPVSYLHLKNPEDFKPPFDQEHALLLIVEETLSKENMLSLTDKIASSNCQYFLCRGNDNSLWEDMVDESCFEQGRFMMTTSHDEPLDDTLFFFINCVIEPEKNQPIHLKCIMALGGDGKILELCKNTIESKNEA